MSAAHILVVDDEPDIRELVGDILGDENYSVAAAEDAAGARQALRDRRPDLILLSTVSVCSRSGRRSPAWSAR